MTNVLWQPNAVRTFVMVRWKGLEPPAYWFVGTKKHFLSILNFTKNRIFRHYIVILSFLLCCILCIVCTQLHLFSRFSMCKICAKMCSAFWSRKKAKFSRLWRWSISRTFYRVQFEFLHDSKLHHQHRFSGRVWDKAERPPFTLHGVEGGCLLLNQQLPYYGENLGSTWCNGPV